MRKYWYIIPMVLCITLLFQENAKAATSNVTVSFNDNNGTSFTVRGQSYTSIPYDEQERITNPTTNTYGDVYKWHLAENLAITGLQAGKYYSGYVYFRVNISPSDTSIQNGQPVMQNTYITEGAYMYISSVATRQYNVFVVLDNYKVPVGGILGLNTITQDFWLPTSAQTTITTANFTTTLTNMGVSMTYSDSVVNDRLSGIIFNAVYEGTYQQFEDVIALLSQIRTNDLSYYAQLVSNLNTIDVDINLIYSRLTEFYNRNHNDFTAAQTVLDLFPNYITQVLTYWQQLLNMNARQSSEADEQNQNYNEHQNEADQALAGASVTMPDQGNISFDINSQIDSTQQNNFFSFLSLIAHNQFITTLLLIGVTAMIAGYILYGKK